MMILRAEGDRAAHRRPAIRDSVASTKDFGRTADGPNPSAPETAPAAPLERRPPTRLAGRGIPGRRPPPSVRALRRLRPVGAVPVSPVGHPASAGGVVGPLARVG